MIIVKNNRYIKKHVIGGAGIFATVSNFLKRLFTSNAAKSVASKLVAASKTELGKAALSAAKQVGLQAIDVGKDLAIAKAKQLVDERPAAATNQRSSVVTSVPGTITEQSRQVLTDLINSATVHTTTNINKILAGSGNAVRIQDLVRKLNGSGLKIV